MSTSVTHSGTTVQTSTSLPYRFWIGIGLIGIWWPVAWLQIQPISDNYFFPLWLGFILAVDGLVYYRTRTSLAQRAGWRFILLFILSAPVWWLFEGFNQILNNWNYQQPGSYGPIEYAARATLPFATVIPAVFVASELVASFKTNPLRRLPRLTLDRRTLLILHACGWTMLLAVLFVPRFAFPLVWISLFFILDPLATLAGGRSIGAYLGADDWSPVWNVAIGALLCGFFWEMWNYYSLPKWTYSIPYFETGHVFEMPVLGYGGYIPFGLELFSFYVLVATLAPWLRLPNVHLSRNEQN